MNKEDAKKIYSNVCDWKFIKSDVLIPVGYINHSCMDCANAVKIGEKCSKEQPSDFTALDAVSKPCWIN